MTGQLKAVIKIGTVLSFLGLALLSIVTTTPLEDFALLMQLGNMDLLLIDIVSLLLGGFGFVYYFLLPALPLYLDINEKDFFIQIRNFVKIIVISSICCFCLQIIFMVANISHYFPLIPILIFMVAFIFRVFNPRDEINHDNNSQSDHHIFSGISKSMILLGTIIVTFALIIRFVVYQSMVVEYSDGWTYHTLINLIFSNDFIFNDTTSVWAPLYFFQGALMNTFTSSTLVSLKVLSFYYSLILVLPTLLILDRLNFKNSANNYVLFMGSIAIIVYPWIISMASVNLQDSMLTFYVVAFFGLLYSSGMDNAILAGFAGALAFLSRYSWGILGPLGVLFLIIAVDKDRLKTIVVYSIAFLSIVGTWVFRNLIVAGVMFSTTDESRFSVEFLLPGIIDNLKRLTYDKHGMNSVMLWAPIVLVVVLILARSEKRNILFDWIKAKELLFLFLALAFEFIVLALFESHQSRFLIGIIWIIPVILVILINGLDINKEISLIGFAIFGFLHSLFLIRTYWIWTYGRLPLHELVDLHRIIEITMPPLSSWVSAAIACILLFTYVAYEKIIKKEPNTMRIKPEE